MMPQSEYRPTEYMQGWISFWMNKERRLETARDFQRARCDFLEKHGGKIGICMRKISMRTILKSKEHWRFIEVR